MLIAKYIGMHTNTKIVQKASEGVPEIKNTTTRYRYQVSADQPAELEEFKALQGEHLVLVDDDPSKPIWFSSKIFTEGWVELGFTKDRQFVYPKDDRSKALASAIAQHGSVIGAALGQQAAVEIQHDLDVLFPKRKMPVFGAKPVTQDIVPQETGKVDDLE